MTWPKFELHISLSVRALPSRRQAKVQVKFLSLRTFI